jgi:DNA mismatch repair ATPase MutS
LIPLFRDLAEVLEKIVRPLGKIFKQYISLNGGFLGRLRHEMGFYIAACRLFYRLKEQNLPLCFPTITPIEERVCDVSAAYNLNLVRHQMIANPGLNIGERIVQNDCLMGDQWGRIFILTGPNQGGKTTYTQMVGIIQIMAQAGLFIPGQAARISPVDGIYTHYPIEEKLERETGRFGDEAQRLSDIFKEASRYSLILLNESLASTSPGESIYLAQDIIKIFRQMGVRVIFNTHLHDLAENIDEINQTVRGDSVITSLVASKINGVENIGDGHRSYRIYPGPPMGRSHALEIAVKYGISYDQLQLLLVERGLIGGG